jgi:hypothetical protein
MRAWLALVFTLGATLVQAQGMFEPYAPTPALILGTNRLNCATAPLPYPYNRDVRRGQQTNEQVKPAPPIGGNSHDGSACPTH